MLTENDIRSFVKHRIRNLIDDLDRNGPFVNDFEEELDITIEVERAVSYNKEASEYWHWFDGFFDDHAHGFGDPGRTVELGKAKARMLEDCLLRLYRLI